MSIRQNDEKTITAVIKLLQHLVYVVIAGRIVDMVNVIMHQLFSVKQSLAKPSGEINITSKVDLISILIVGLHTSSDVPNAALKTCALIDGQPP